MEGDTVPWGKAHKIVTERLRKKIMLVTANEWELHRNSRGKSGRDASPAAA